MERKELMIIKKADLMLESHGWFMLALKMESIDPEGYCSEVTFGLRRLAQCTFGRGWEVEKVNPKLRGLEEIIKVMSVFGVEKFSDLEGKEAYIYFQDGEIYKIENKQGTRYFDYHEFYRDED